MPRQFSIDIEDVVDLLGLERERRSQTRGAPSFYVKCPFCNDRKYHMSINTNKNSYYCVLCTGDRKGTGALDLYGRVALNTPHILGSTGNGKELYAKLCDALNIGNTGNNAYSKARALRPVIKDSRRTSDDNLHAAYSVLLQISYFKLSAKHKENLVSRGLSESAIIRNQYRSIDPDFSWIQNHPAYVDVYHSEGLAVLHKKEEVLKWYDKDKVIAGLIVAAAIEKQGVNLAGVPGFFKLGRHWCFKVETGMLIPTRNNKRQIVALQARKDTGTIRYMTISAKGLPYAVSEGISRAHYPLENALIGPDTVVMITEGPLKGDVSVHLLEGDVLIIALQGTNNTNEIPQIISYLKSAGVKNVYNAFDMDKTTNPHVAKAGRNLRRAFKEHGLSMPMKCWDDDFAKVKEAELLSLSRQHDIPVPTDKIIYTRIGLMAQALSDRGVEHSIVTLDDGTELKNYWSEKTKGLDDYLLSLINKKSGKDLTVEAR